MADTEKTQGVVVFVPQRPGFDGSYSAGEHWKPGTNPVEVVADEAAKKSAVLQSRKDGSDKRIITAAQLGILKSEPPSLLSVMTAADAVKAAGFDSADIAQDDEERALLKAHRAAKAAKAPKSNEQPKK